MGVEKMMHVLEDELVVTVCASVTWPMNNCHVELPFSVELSTVDNTSGSIH